MTLSVCLIVLTYKYRNAMEDEHKKCYKIDERESDGAYFKKYFECWSFDK